MNKKRVRDVHVSVRICINATNVTTTRYTCTHHLFLVHRIFYFSQFCKRDGEIPPVRLSSASHKLVTPRCVGLLGHYS
jgi:hypothetical protein